MPSLTPTKDAPEVLADDMCPSDLIEILEHLDFGIRGNGHAVVRLDKGVRDYLITRIRPHART
jgi:hypothetical protein